MRASKCEQANASNSLVLKQYHTRYIHSQSEEAKRKIMRKQNEKVKRKRNIIMGKIN